jgi:hypothetical protein
MSHTALNHSDSEVKGLSLMMIDSIDGVMNDDVLTCGAHGSLM